MLFIRCAESIAPGIIEKKTGWPAMTTMTGWEWSRFLVDAVLQASGMKHTTRQVAMNRAVRQNVDDSLGERNSIDLSSSTDGSLLLLGQSVP
jgi:hypothetical protein